MGDQALFTRLVDDIYGSVLAPARRTEVLGAVSGRLGGHAAVWFVPDGADPQASFIGLSGLEPRDLEPWFDYYAERDPWQRAARRYAAPAVLTGAELGTIHSGLEDDECLNDFVRDRLGAEDVCTSVLEHGEPWISHVSVYRSPGAQPLDEASLRFMECLLPHFRRASELYRRLGRLSLGSAMVEQMIDEGDRAVFVVDAGRRVIRMNASAREVTQRDDGLAVTGGCLQVRGPGRSQRLDGLIRDALRRGPGDGAGTDNTEMVVPRRAMHDLPYVVSASALGSGDPSLDDRPLVLVVVQVPSGVAQETWVRVSRLYGLTGQETRVAIHLTDGHSIAETADLLGITVNTCRTHVKALFSKTGTSRQAELVSTLLKFK